MKHKVMGRAALGFGLVWALALGSTAFSLAGCSDDSVAERETKSGTADFALSGTSSSGVVYRLRDAQIEITGAASMSLTTEDYVDQTQISLELLAGGYIADLLDGWRLERLVDGAFEDVRAILISTDPQPFTVIDQGTTDVRLRFRAGDDVVELGNGRVLIGIDVIDDTTPPPPEDCFQACEVADQLNPECANLGFCADICGNLDLMVAGTGCEPLAQEYMMCAAGVPGEEYVCAPTEPPVAVAEPCIPMLIDTFNCASNPPPTCDLDQDGDGWCNNQGDCNDFDPGTFPGAFDMCGDMIDQNCNGIDDCVPPGWHCDPFFFGDGICDCGCGDIDADCPDSTSSACMMCDAPGSCAQGWGCGVIDPNFNAVCNFDPCMVDNDFDGWPACQDCDDSRGDVFPGAAEICGDGIDQNCNGIDDSCGPPASWFCMPHRFGSGDGCDCGCGEIDPDCGGDVTVMSCEFCNGPGSCAEGFPDCSIIDPNFNAFCL